MFQKLDVRFCQNRHQIFLLRHGHRNKILPLNFGNELPLTEEGKKSAENLGQHLRKIRWGEIHSSPLIRCQETAQYFLKGLGQHLSINLSSVLGNPGPFVSDSIKAGPVFLKHSLPDIIQRMISNQTPSGMRTIQEGAKVFVNYIKTVRAFPCLMISHDSIISLLYSYFLKKSQSQIYIPDFLEGFCLTFGTDTLTIHSEDQQATYPLIDFE